MEESTIAVDNENDFEPGKPSKEKTSGFLITDEEEEEKEMVENDEPGLSSSMTSIKNICRSVSFSQIE